MDPLNYHHLRYFHAIAREGSLTKAAKRLRISQSALSIQLKKLEESLGCFLFDREHKSLSLTEEGRMVLNYADSIFRTGEEMLATLKNRGGRYRSVLRVGAVSTLSKNFQISFLKDVLDDQEVEVVIYAASMRVLLGQLRAHSIDIILSNTPVAREIEPTLKTQLVSEQPISLVAPRSFEVSEDFRFPESLQGVPVVLPSRDSNLRSGFDIMMEQSGVSPLIAVEANDMAMLRLVAKETQAITLVPPIVVQDELNAGTLRELCRVPDLSEMFYAITAERRFPNPYVSRLLGG